MVCRFRAGRNIHIEIIFPFHFYACKKHALVVTSSHMFFVHAAKGMTLQSILSLSHRALSSATVALTHFGSKREDEYGLADIKT